VAFYFYLLFFRVYGLALTSVNPQINKLPQIHRLIFIKYYLSGYLWLIFLFYFPEFMDEHQLIYQLEFEAQIVFHCLMDQYPGNGGGYLICKVR